MSRRSIRILVVPVLALVCAGVVLAVTQAHGQNTTPAPTSATATSQVPADPVTHYSTNHEFFESDGRGQYGNATNTNPRGNYAGYFTSGYWVSVPPSYARDNQTPETLMVWMHGCEGTAKYDDQALSYMYNRDRPYIVISLSGPENAGVDKGDPNCWNTSDQDDVAKVLADVANVETHFNIDRRRVFIGGYSSGGDLAWQTIFLHADTFAGILAINTNPVRDNTFGARWGLTAIKHAIAGAAWKFNVVQLDHSGDDTYHVARCGYPGTPAKCPSGDFSGDTYPDAGVTPALQAMKAAGFPVDYMIRPGLHYNPDTPKGCEVKFPATCTFGTYHDVAHYLMPEIMAHPSWGSPAS